MIVATADPQPARKSLHNEIAIDGAGNLYISETYSQRIRKITAGTGIINTVAGNGLAGYSGDGGAATSASLYYPEAIAVDSAGNIYIADSNNARVRKVTAGTGVISTIAGTGVFGYSGDQGPATEAQLETLGCCCRCMQGISISATKATIRSGRSLWRRINGADRLCRLTLLQIPEPMMARRWSP